jgi:hypothetical protein
MDKRLSYMCNINIMQYNRGLARDIIHDVTDGRRHVGGIFFAWRHCKSSVDCINEQTRVYKEAYSSLNFSGSLGKNHQVKFGP